ncbi:MAG: type IA DNA topoisomerase [Eubacterium sp.]|nr:type IA DNA topoisomerase [Eubacterium sp.]
MGKRVFIAEKPSVAKEFAKVMGINGAGKDGFMESDDAIVTWCVGHLVTMSYPEVYDASLKKWNLDTLPFLPDHFLYEVIPGVKKQFDIVSKLLNREDVESIYVCTDSGREGEYIYRLVDSMAKVPDTKNKFRVWIDSQTEDEIKRGVKEAKPLAEYDNLSDAAYLRAKEDYLMGINFSRALSVRYGGWLNNNTNDKKWTSISVGRVMSCVLGMVVKREWEIREFKKTPFYRVIGDFSLSDKNIQAEWKVKEGSFFYDEKIIDYSLSSVLYKENGFRKKEDAESLIKMLGMSGVIKDVKKKQEKKNPPLLFNLAELQNLSSKLFKISPDETLQIVQDLYERKLVTYPRTDARVLSTAVAKEIGKNLNGLRDYELVKDNLKEIAEMKSYQGLEKTRYVNDKKITDHYAIIPTGSGISGLGSMSELHQKMYEVIVRRFLAIFYPPAVYSKLNVEIEADSKNEETVKKESFFTSAKVLIDEGFLGVSKYSFTSEKKKKNSDDEEKDEEEFTSDNLSDVVDLIKKGTEISCKAFNIKEGETTPPKRYNSGSIILAMENAGQLIEDEELRAQIKGSGIGTSATRAEILKKLINIGYLKLNKKTQIITPAYKGELVYSVICYSMPMMLSPKMTASWEMGLSQVAEGTIKENEYMVKLSEYIKKMVDQVKNENQMQKISRYHSMIEKFYSKK